MLFNFLTRSLNTARLVVDHGLARTSRSRIARLVTSNKIKRKENIRKERIDTTHVSNKIKNTSFDKHLREQLFYYVIVTHGVRFVKNRRRNFPLHTHGRI